jgi:hypothetical protein
MRAKLERTLTYQFSISRVTAGHIVVALSADGALEGNHYTKQASATFSILPISRPAFRSNASSFTGKRDALTPTTSPILSQNPIGKNIAAAKQVQETVLFLARDARAFLMEAACELCAATGVAVLGFGG